MIDGGSQLVVGGEFRWIGATPATYVAVFDGATWSGLGAGPAGPASALATLDLSGIPTLFAGGEGYLAAWDGQSWTTFNVGGEIDAMHVHDDGSGPALYIGGSFQTIDGNSIKNLARFDGTWSSVGQGLTFGTVRAFASHDAGSGTDLYVGGAFDAIGGVQTRGIARWDGSAFHAVGGGLDGQPGFGTQVRAMASVVGPGGVPELHVGGKFLFAGGSPSQPWAIWRQGAWSEADSSPDQVYAMTLRDSPGGVTVCASRPNRVDCYDGVSLTTLPQQVTEPAISLAAFGGGLPQNLYAGTEAVNETGSHLARWTGMEWRALFEGPAIGLGIPGGVTGLGVHDFGAGEELVVVGSPYAPLFTDELILRLAGSEWIEVPTSGLTLGIHRDTRSIDGSLYLAGENWVAGSDETWPVVRLDGNQWTPVGSHMPSSGRAISLTTFDSGTGPELYVGGYFTGLDNPATRGIARLEGEEWVSVAGGISGSLGITNNTVHKLLTWNDGTGNALYAGGGFFKAGDQNARSIARWDGNAWTTLAGGVTHSLPGPAYIYDMVLFSGPQGERLIAGGTFESAGGVPCQSIAAWDGTSWSPLGGGVDGAILGLHAFDPDGQGERLYVMGAFSTAGGVAVENSAVWDGFSWSASDLPTTPQPRMQTFDDGSGRALFVAGQFQEVGGVASNNIAKFSDPCGATLGYPECTALPNSTGNAATVRATGLASVAAMNITLLASKLPPAANTLFFYGTESGMGTAGDGLLCIGGTIQRILPVIASSSNGVATLPFDFQAPYAANAVAGESIVIQGFFRDAQGGPAGFQTTDSLRIPLRP